ncbi:MAG: POTRA domain-containing protein [Bacteroidota bacterium]
MRLVRQIYTAWLVIIICSNTGAQTVDKLFQVPAPLPANISVDSISGNKLFIRNITIKGNRKTKDYMILREIQFKAGDSIAAASVGEAFQLARQQVYNTTLFNEVKLEFTMLSAVEIEVTVNVKERWYLYPAPQFQLVDRNLNEWWVKYKRDLSRVNYGVKFVHYNFSGRRDPLRIYLINGYTRNISFSYSQPYSNRTLTQGFGIGGGLAQNREMPYKTGYNNQILFFKKEDFVKKNLYGNISLRLQKGILSRQTINVGFSYLKINDSILSPKYNPAYFNDNVSSKNIVDLSYTWQYANIDNIAYPLKGVKASAVLLKRGLGLTGGINLLSTEVNYNRYWAHTHNWYTSIQLFGNIKLPFNQPYINQRALGYGETNLRGLEYYVVDGVAFGLAKATLRKKVFSFSIPFPIKSSSHTSIPFTFYAKTFADAGFTYNKREYLTRLNNRLLYSGGFGIDVLTLYDVHVRFEYSFNQLGEHGLFLRSQGGL